MKEQTVSKYIPHWKEDVITRPNTKSWTWCVEGDIRKMSNGKDMGCTHDLSSLVTEDKDAE